MLRVIGLFILILMAIGFLDSTFGNKRNSDRTDTTEVKPPAHRAPVTAEDRARRVEQYIENLVIWMETIDSADLKGGLDRLDNINDTLRIIDGWATLLDEGKRLNLNEDQRARWKAAHNKASRMQADALPVVRDSFGPVLRRELWEADASARTIGAGYRTVEFVSAVFAANRNIATVHRDWLKPLYRLRFTRANYKWHAQAREYSYYELEPPPDTTIVIWTGSTTWREINQ